MSGGAGGDLVTYAVDNGVATLIIDRAERRNALNSEVIEGLSVGLEAADADDAVGAVVLTGAGDKAFCAGGDLGGISGEGPAAQHFIRGEVGDLFKQMRAARFPIVARVNGHALAGGFGLMLACDLVVAAAEAEIGTPEINLGLWPFMISAVIQRDLPRKVGLEMMLTGRRMTAEEAHGWGFVNRVVPGAELDKAVEDLMSTLVSHSPLIASLGKRSFYRAESMAFDEALEYLAGMLTVTLSTEDAAEGVSAFFQKRDPEWKNR